MKNKGANEVNGGNTLRGKCAIRERVRYRMLIKRSTIFGEHFSERATLPFFRNFVNLSPIIVKIGCINSVACASTQFCPDHIFFIFTVLQSTIELRKLASPRTATSLSRAVKYQDSCSFNNKKRGRKKVHAQCFLKDNIRLSRRS